MTSSLRSGIGRRAIVPEWLLSASASAVKLFAVLDAKYADREGAAFPSRKTLAADLGVSMDTIDRTLRELVTAGALTIEHRRVKGGLTSSLYVLIHTHRTDAATPSRTDAATLAADLAAPMRHQYPVVTPSLDITRAARSDDRGQRGLRHIGQAVEKVAEAARAG